MERAPADLYEPLLPVALFTFAFVLRLVAISRAYYRLDDSVLNVTTARHYLGSGILGPDNWWTQPLKHVTLALSIHLFGDDPIGWRMRNVLFGAFLAAAVYVLARELFKTRRPAVFAGLIVALDPLAIALSRQTGEDIQAVLLTVLFMVTGLKYLRTRKTTTLLLTGGLIGLSWATRWYTVFPSTVLLAVMLISRQESRGKDAARVIACAAVLPLAVYLATYLPWLTRGYSLWDWVVLQADSYRVQAAGLPGFFEDLKYMAKPARWFSGWVGGVNRLPYRGAYAIMMNNPPVWGWFLPSLFFLLWRAAAARSLKAAVVGANFIALYVFFLTSTRPIMLYSSISLLPFGALAVGFGAGKLPRLVYGSAITLTVLWCCYLYPLVVALPVRDAWYAWLLDRLLAG